MLEDSVAVAKDSNRFDMDRRIVGRGNINWVEFIFRLLVGGILAAGVVSLGGNPILIIIAGGVLGHFSALSLCYILPDLSKKEMQKITVAWLFPNCVVAARSVFSRIDNWLDGTWITFFWEALVDFKLALGTPIFLVFLLVSASLGGSFFCKSLGGYVAIPTKPLRISWMFGFLVFFIAMLLRKGWFVVWFSAGEMFWESMRHNVTSYILVIVVINSLTARELYKSYPHA